MVRKIIRLIGAILLLFIIIIDFMFFFELKKTNGNVTKATIGVLEKVANTITESEPIFVLVLGVNNDLGQSLADTIMCCGYNPSTQKAFIVSIPRDTFVGNNILKVTASDKINAIYNKKNPEKIMEKISKLTQIDINNYVTINNDALIKLVDIVGGVEFNVPIDMNYDDKTQNLHIHLKKGVQLIDGKKAEALLRFRHNNNGSSYPSSYGDNDYGRMRTQREFVMAIIEKCLKTKSIDEIKEMMKLAFENIDTNISLSYVLSYLVYAYSFNIENLKLEQLPGNSVYSNHVWVFQEDEEESNELFQKILEDFYK